MGLTHTMGRNHNIDIAINLTRDMNDFTKFAIMAMRGHWNVTGSGQVLGWQYGFPYAVDLSRRDQARHQTGETTSVDLLNRNEVEACFYIATDPGAHFPVDAMISSSKKPTVTIDPHINCTTEISDIHIPVAMVGVEDRRLRLSYGQRPDRDPQGRRPARGHAHGRGTLDQDQPPC